VSSRKGKHQTKPNKNDIFSCIVKHFKAKNNNATISLTSWQKKNSLQRYKTKKKEKDRGCTFLKGKKQQNKMHLHKSRKVLKKEKVMKWKLKRFK